MSDSKRAVSRNPNEMRRFYRHMQYEVPNPDGGADIVVVSSPTLPQIERVAMTVQENPVGSMVELVRECLREVNGVPYTPIELKGAQLEAVLSPGQILILGELLNDLNGGGDSSAVRESGKAVPVSGT